MKIKLAVFDLDGTLARVGEQILTENVELLKSIRKTGCRTALCSGKPAYYLCGLARQIGIKDMILMGENGGTIQFGVELPPERYYELPYSPQAGETIRYLGRRIQDEIPGIFFQPDQIMLTPFPADEKEKEIIKNIFQREKENIRDVTIYEHADSFDIVPVGIDKGKSLSYLCRLMNIGLENVLAAGDGVNDLPMLRDAGYTAGVNMDQTVKVDRNLKNTESMLKYVLNKVLNN